MKRHVLHEGTVREVVALGDGNAGLTIARALDDRSDDVHRVNIPAEMARVAFGQPARVVVEVGDPSADDPEAIETLRAAIGRHIAARVELTKERDAFRAQLLAITPIDAKYILRTEVAALLEAVAVDFDGAAAGFDIKNPFRAETYSECAGRVRRLVEFKILSPMETP